MPTRSLAVCSKPSVTRNPAASSRSSPGVRMTMAMLWPSTRISNGSSVARKSLSSDSVHPVIRRIGTSRTGPESKSETIASSVGGPKSGLGRHDYDLILLNCVERRSIDAKMRHHQFWRRVSQPICERQVLVVAALVHFEKYQICVTCILDVMQKRFLHVSNVSRLKIQRASAIPRRHYRHSSLSTNIILPLVGIRMPM